jgi:hypothetical protein
LLGGGSVVDLKAAQVGQVAAVGIRRGGDPTDRDTALRGVSAGGRACRGHGRGGRAR